MGPDAREDLAREGARRRERLAGRLGLDAAAAAPIGWLLDVADLGLDAARALAERSEAMAAFIAERLARRDRDGSALDADTLLREAAALLEGARPALAGYGARKAVWAAWRDGTAAALPRYLRPEPGLRRPPGAPPCPAPDPRWREYRDIYAPAEVIAAPAGALPDGAILPLLRCLSLATNEHSYGGGAPDEHLVGFQLRRYRDRVYPGLLEILADPVGHAWGGAPGAGQLRQCAFDLAAGLTPAPREAFFRLALESGWADALRALPDGDDKARLGAEYDDSPYGPPLAMQWSPAAAWR